MKPLSKTQLWITWSMLAFGLLMVITDLISVVSLSVGYTFIAMAIILLMLECGPYMWYWWVSFRWGYHVTLPAKVYMNDSGEIEEWLKDNITFKFMHINNGEAFFFLRKSDAMGFKLRWI